MCAQLVAGAAVIDITPPVGTPMCGFGNRSGPAAGIHDALCASALYLGSGPQELLIITADLIGLDRASVAEVRAQINAATGIGTERIMIGCSHTHSGPTTPCLPFMGNVDQAYMHTLLRSIAGVGIMARSQAVPSALGHGREPVSVGVNRRDHTAEGVVMRPNEAGVRIPWVDVVAVDTMEGAPLARFFVHAAHAVTLGPDNLLFSADWPGAARRAVERIYGDGCTALFGQGCCGNINSDPRGDFAIAEMQGLAMAGAVVKAAEHCLKEPEVILGAAVEHINLPCFDPPSVEEAEKQLAHAREALEAEAQQSEHYKDFLRGCVSWAERLVKLAREGATGLSVPFEIQCFRIGDMALAAMPGEIFAEYALHVDATDLFSQTATVGYANGNIGYVPTAAAYPEGGYEVNRAYQYYGDTMIRPESEAMIHAAADRLLTALQPGT